MPTGKSEDRGQDVVASMIEKLSVLYADHGHEGVRPDAIQDEENTALRST